MIRRALPSGALACALSFAAAALVSNALPSDVHAQDEEAAEEEEEEPEPELSDEELAEIYGRKGPYLGARAVGMFPTGDLLVPGVRVEDDARPGFAVQLGLRTASWMALEVMYEQVYGPVVSAAGETEERRGWFWSLNSKFYPYAKKRWQPYGLVGFGVVSVKPKFVNRRTGFGMRFAGGLDYHITHKIVAAVEGGYNLGIGSQVEDYGYAVITGGVIFRF